MLHICVLDGLGGRVRGASCPVRVKSCVRVIIIRRGRPEHRRLLAARSGSGGRPQWHVLPVVRTAVRVVSELIRIGIAFQLRSGATSTLCYLGVDAGVEHPEPCRLRCTLDEVSVRLHRKSSQEL